MENEKDDIDKNSTLILRLNSISKNFQKRFTNAMSGSEKVRHHRLMIENNRILYSDPDKSFVIPLTNISKIRLAKSYSVSFSSITYRATFTDCRTMLILQFWYTMIQYGKEPESTFPLLKHGMNLKKQKTFASKEKRNACSSLCHSNMGLADSMFMIWQQTEIPIVTKDGKPDFNSPQFIEFVKNGYPGQNRNNDSMGMD